MLNVVCVVSVCPVHAVDVNSLTLRGLSSSLDKKCIKKREKEDVKMKMLMDLNKALFTPSH